MFEQKLTPEEITRVVRKIRQRYEDYVFKFFKSKTLKFAFEDRYHQVLRGRTWRFQPREGSPG